MEAVEVESKGSHGGDDHRKDRRSSWGCTLLLVNNCFQYTAYFGVSTNLVNYLKVQLHSGSKAAANSVTNWQGTASITPLAAAFLADSFLGRYWTITVFLLISVAGYGVVTASASAALESAMLFYAGLYLVALGGALQPVLSSFGADQFDVEADEEERGRQSSFFNWFYLSINVGSLVGGTVLVWVQSAHGWRLGYGIPALLSVVAVALFLAGTGTYRRHQPPGGSPLTRIAQVVVAAARKCDVEPPADATLLHELDGEDGMSAILGSRRLAHTDQFRSVAQCPCPGRRWHCFHLHRSSLPSSSGLRQVKFSKKRRSVEILPLMIEPCRLFTWVKAPRTYLSLECLDRTRRS
uniref:Peptide transporter PTR2 n=2 Tax=Aegilops tauschii subsp. strangulata TaxID=200361 RepID=A0A453G3D3_AEGTS